MSLRALLLLPLAALAACDKPSATIEINADNGATRLSATPGKENSFKIDAPGLKADINLPFMGAISGNMDIDGVKLYPDTKVQGINVNANEGENDGQVTMRFTAPAVRAKVTDWFNKQFADNGFKMTLNGDRFTGATDEGKAVTLDMRDGAGGTTDGELRIEGKP